MSEENESWALFHDGIDQRLNELRPPRSGQYDRDWREPVYGWARNHIPNESRLVHVFAEKEVNTREANMTKRGNRYLRDWCAVGAFPLLWSDLGPLPIIVEKVRIRMDAATPDDFDDAARELEVNAKKNYDATLIVVGAMRDLARMARRGGLTFVAQVGDLPGRESDSPDDGWGEDDDL
jgi:hypothetical protein